MAAKKCPNCGSEMEWENHVGKNPVTYEPDMPEANYWCDDCGYQMDWFLKPNRFVVTWDPRAEGTDNAYSQYRHLAEVG